MNEEIKNCECFCHRDGWDKKEHGIMKWCSKNCFKLSKKKQKVPEIHMMIEGLPKGISAIVFSFIKVKE